MLTVVALDFGSKRLEEITAAGIPDAVAAGRYCWVDAEAVPPEQVAAAAAALGLPAVPGGEEDARWATRASPSCSARPPRGSRARRARTRRPGKRARPAHRPRGAVAVRRGMRRACREDFERHSRSHGFLLYEIADRIVEGYRHEYGAVRPPSTSSSFASSTSRRRPLPGRRRDDPAHLLAARRPHGRAGALPRARRAPLTLRPGVDPAAPRPQGGRPRPARGDLAAERDAIAGRSTSPWGWSRTDGTAPEAADRAQRRLPAAHLPHRGLRDELRCTSPRCTGATATSSSGGSSRRSSPTLLALMRRFRWL